MRWYFCPTVTIIAVHQLCQRCVLILAATYRLFFSWMSGTQEITWHYWRPVVCLWDYSFRLLRAMKITKSLSNAPKGRQIPQQQLTLACRVMWQKHFLKHNCEWQLQDVNKYWPVSNFCEVIQDCKSKFQTSVIINTQGSDSNAKNVLVILPSCDHVAQFYTVKKQQLYSVERRVPI